MKKLYLYLTYEQNGSGGEICEGEDPNNPYASHNDTVLETEFQKIWLSEPAQFFYDSQSINEDLFQTIQTNGHAYLVIVIYGTGATFGRTTGCFKWIDTFDNKEAAEKLKFAVENNLYRGSTPWTGYFETLEEVKIEKLDLYDL